MRLAETIEGFDVNSVESVRNVLKSIHDFLQSVDMNTLRKMEEEIDIQKRRYGWGAINVDPYGYYYPSKVMPEMTTNAKRGRVVKKNGVEKYIYDYDFENRIKRIISPYSDFITYCIYSDRCEEYISMRNSDERDKMVSIRILGDDEKLQKMITVTGNIKSFISEIDYEIYCDDGETRQIVEQYRIFIKEMTDIIYASKKDYCMFYDEFGKYIDSYCSESYDLTYVN